MNSYIVYKTTKTKEMTIKKKKENKIIWFVNPHLKCFNYTKDTKNEYIFTLTQMQICNPCSWTFKHVGIDAHCKANNCLAAQRPQTAATYIYDASIHNIVFLRKYMVDECHFTYEVDHNIGTLYETIAAMVNFEDVTCRVVVVIVVSCGICGNARRY